MINAKDAITFKVYFNSCLNACRAITNALQKEGKHIPGFEEWYKQKQEEMKNDELLRFIHKARTEDFHEGKHRLVFVRSFIHSFSSEDAGTPPSPDATLIIGTEGMFWIVNRGTPYERRIPIRKGKYTIEVAIDNPPQVHLGKKLKKNDPVTICKLALNYFTDLVAEAKSKFGTKQKYMMRALQKEKNKIQVYV